MEKSVQSTKIINRNTSIELLRIISMIMIMFHHFAYHGNFEWNFNEVTLPHLWYDFILMVESWCRYFRIDFWYFLLKIQKSYFS